MEIGTAPTSSPDLKQKGPSVIARRSAFARPKTHSPVLVNRLGTHGIFAQPPQDASSDLAPDPVRPNQHVALERRKSTSIASDKAEGDASGGRDVGGAATVEVGDTRRESSDEEIKKIGAGEGPRSARLHAGVYQKCEGEDGPMNGVDTLGSPDFAKDLVRRSITLFADLELVPQLYESKLVSKANAKRP
jgi:hypothetical protein